MLAPLAVLVAYEAGYALFRAIGPAVAVAIAQVTVTALAPGHGGAYTALGLPATASRQLLVPAALALALAYVRAPGRALLASTAAAGLVLAVVHPTYAIFLWIPFAGFLVLRSLVVREEARPIAAALAALVVPAGLFFAWLLPGRPRYGLGRPLGDRDAASDRALRGAARSDLGHALPPRARGVRPRRGGRGGSAPAAAARRACSAAALGSVRARRGAGRLRRDARRRSLRPVLRPRLALAVASRGGLLAARVCLRRRPRRPHGTAARLRAPVRAARRDRVPARLSRRLRLPAGARRPGGRDVDRGRRQRGRGRLRPSAAPAGVRLARGARRLCGGALRFPVVVHAAWNWSASEERRPSPLTAGLVDRAARAGPGARASSTPISRPVTGSPPTRPSTLRMRRQVTSPTRRRTGRTSACRGAPVFAATWRSRAGRRCRLARRRSRPLPRAARPSRARRCAAVSRRDDRLPSPACEAPARLALLPAVGRWRGPAAAQVRAVPARARDRDARARAGRSEVDPRRRRAPRPPRPGCTARATSGRRGAGPPRSCMERPGSSARLSTPGSASRRLLVPDENVSWNLTAIPAAIRIARKEKIDVVLTTSPPNSVHLVGAAVKRATGAKWVADLRDSLVAHPHRRAESLAVRGEGEGRRGRRPARRPLRRRDHVRLGRDRGRGARASTRAAGSSRSRTAATSTTSQGSTTTPASASGSRTPAASSASATRGRS